MASLALAMGTTFRGVQKLLGTNKSFIYYFFDIYFSPYTTINCEAARRTPI